MFDIRKVTPDDAPQACLPYVSCAPLAPMCIPDKPLCNPAQNIICTPSYICLPSSTFVCLPNKICVPKIALYRNVSGSYRSGATSGSVLELRVDVDGTRPQSRVSGDMFSQFSFLETLAEARPGVKRLFERDLLMRHRFGFLTIYSYSFVVESLSVSETGGVMTITGPVRYYNDPANNNDTIEVTIPRVAISAAAADATVKFYDAGTLISTFICPKISAYFRAVTLEIDRFQGTTFPPSANTNTGLHPADLPNEDLTCAEVFRRTGVDMTITEDDVLNDADSADAGTNWSEAELHDLMEDRFDLFSNTLQWNCYGVVVPRFGDPAYNSGYYGTMFDWGGWQAGDTHLRQGAAVAYDAILGRSSGTLYDSAAKKDRLFLQTFVHEIGHSFNFPHSWQRSANPDSASESFMNYPWGYTGGAGTESAFWSNFRWQFDDVELIWVRHGDRNDVIFGGRDWIGNNLSIYATPDIERQSAPLTLEARAWDVFDFGQPVRVELKLKNVSDKKQKVNGLLQPEDGTVALYVTRPNREIVRYVPPVRRCEAPGEVELAPGESLYETALLSYSAKGALFQEPGEYVVRAYYNAGNDGMIVSPGCRLRVANPMSRGSEELAHILFSHEAARFLYFGGTERYPAVTSSLKEAVEKYAKTDPSVVRHIAAALGNHASRPFKQVISKKGKRVIVRKEVNINEAVTHLEAARALIPVRRVSALDNITYNRMSIRLAESYLKQDKKAEAVQTLQESLKYLETRRVVKSVIADYKSRLEKLSRK